MPTLTWLTREQDIRAAGAAPYRLLEEAARYGDGNAENMLIQGDNLDSLKALRTYYAGKVKCIYIDPPYNTGSAFEHYDDNLEHSKWLSLMYPRLELLKELLSDEGSIWVSCDEVEGHYIKIIMDEIFGRNNFISDVAWQKRTSPDNRLRLGDAYDHIFVYGKQALTHQSFNQLPINAGRSKDYKNPDNDPRGFWASVDITGMIGHATPSQFYTITSPTGKTFSPPPNRCWAYAEENFINLQQDNRIWFGKTGKSRPRLKKFLAELGGQNAWNWWSNTEVGHNQEAKKEILALFGGGEAFATPKPERLIQRILHIATNPGDLVLDSFLGSGTTAAVAHKMGRRYIGIEIGEHALTHCVPRLEKVIAGEQGGISRAVGWQGGGGFRLYRLGESVFDEAGAIRKNVSFASLAAHIWFSETGVPLDTAADSPFLGVHAGTAYYLLYNGVLGDKKPRSGNVLTAAVLEGLAPHDGPKIIYGERAMLGAKRLKALNITFKQTPYDIRGNREG